MAGTESLHSKKMLLPITLPYTSGSKSLIFNFRSKLQDFNERSLLNILVKFNY